MNYKEIVDKFKGIVLLHKMVHDFGYGDLSDIKVVAEDSEGVNEADYPYAFLNPAGLTQNNAGRVYNFNLILMEMVLENDFLQVQSDCIQYIDDIIAEFNRGTQADDIQLQYSVVVFKERFQDEVAGATASITVNTKEAKNACDAPFPSSDDIEPAEEVETPDDDSDNGGLDPDVYPDNDGDGYPDFSF